MGSCDMFALLQDFNPCIFPISEQNANALILTEYVSLFRLVMEK